MDTLLLPEARAAYENALVNAELGVAGLPDVVMDKTPNQLADRATMSHHLSMLAVSQASNFVLTSKNAPHGIREVMWMDEASTYRDSLLRLERSDIHALFTEAAGFIDTSTEQGLYPSVSWSHDPLTSHRVSIQGEKRFHMHGIARTAEEVQQAYSSRTTIGGLDFVARRRLLDEFAVLGKSIASNFVSVGGLQPLDVHLGLLTIDVGTSERLRDPEFAHKLQASLRKLDVVYTDIVGSIGGENEYGVLQGRNALLTKEGRDFALSESQTAALNYFVNGMKALKDSTIERIAFGPYKHYAKTFIPLAGLAYSVTIAPLKNALAAHIRFCKFSDMGGAGCAVIDGVPTRVRRGQGVMSEAEMQMRTEFQTTVARAITQRTLLGVR